MRHTLRASVSTVHVGFYDCSLVPVLRVRSDDLVEVFTVSGRLELYDLLGVRDKLPKELEEIRREKGSGGHILNGPIYVEEATPNDTLEVTLLEIEPWLNFGTNSFYSGKGSIPEDFPYQRIKCIQIDPEKKFGILSDRLQLPLRPFFGQLGVAPAPFPGKVAGHAPGVHGGNLDNKELVASSKVYFPIFNEGALFSIGDGHASQGDGEVDQSALEICMKGLIKLRVIKGVRTKWPMAETEDSFILMGFGATLDEAFKMALRNTIDFLERKGVNRDDAYMLCSLSVDFHITQTVNETKGVHALIPKALFKDKQAMP